MELIGEIKRIIYKNEVNSYMVAVIETEEEETTVVGYLPFINKGDNIKIIGNFLEHPEYGRQFKIESFEKTMPNTEEGIEKYLSSGKIKGVGPATARKIISIFGKEIISVLRYEPEKLVCIKGITKQKAYDISQNFNENLEVWRLVEYLQKFGIDLQGAETIYKKLGSNIIEQIEKNPYILIDVSPKVDFKQIDRIALKNGIDSDNSKRIESGIKYGLKIASINGHCCVLYENLIQFCKDLLNVSEELIQDSVINLQVLKEIVLENRGTQEWLYLIYYYQAEKNVAENLMLLNKYMNIKAINNFEEKLKKVEKNSNLELSKKQLEAVTAVQNHNICVITGGPGTGKTTIIKIIIDLYKQEEQKIVLCAPTGRAAKKMAEATKEEAKTLHRLLEIGKINSDDIQDIDPNIKPIPVDADIIIVDEMSMVDIFLMNYLLQAVYKGTKLVLVGDINQLPSVGSGNVLKDIINSDQITVITLNKIFRQATKSKIIVNSHKVNEGDMFFLKVENKKESLDDFLFFEEKNQNKVLKQVVSLSTGEINNYGNYDFLNNIQVITPTKKGILGTKELNKILQQEINPLKKEIKEIKWIDTVFREGDKIMQIKNNYDIYWEKNEPILETGKGIFNGEYGIIVNIDEDEKMIKIQFDDKKTAWYKYEEFEQIEHSYAITVHKAQR